MPDSMGLLEAFTFTVSVIAEHHGQTVAFERSDTVRVVELEKWHRLADKYILEETGPEKAYLPVYREPGTNIFKGLKKKSHTINRGKMKYKIPLNLPGTATQMVLIFKAQSMTPSFGKGFVCFLLFVFLLDFHPYFKVYFRSI
jgi:hypothetical protein